MSSKKMTPDKPAEAMKPITNKEEKSSAPKVTKATSKEASKPSSDKEGKLPVKKEEKAPLKEGARPAPAKAEKSSAKKAGQTILPAGTTPAVKKAFPWKVTISWVATALLVCVLLLVYFQGSLFSQFGSTDDNTQSTPTTLNIALPTIQASGDTGVISVSRQANIDTTVPTGVRQSILRYTVEKGDSIFSIAKQFNLKPESVLWANYKVFGDNPTTPLSIGAQLVIPPVDGILYTWKDGDTLSRIADTYDADVSSIVSWPSNFLDATNPVIATGAVVMIPGGSREVQSWIQVVEYTARSGVTKVIAGGGGCEAPSTGPVGSGGFIWPSANHYISGFDYTSSHRGIDIAAQTGDSVWASDNGTVVYAGWNDSGYGNLVMIDHNDGYATLYGHLSAIYTTCGASVYQGTVVGAAGSTGNTTGPHLHFEVRYNSGFVNPWSVLP